MAGWARCAKCRYIRHVNDDGRSRRDTCPMCGAVYDKAEIESVRVQRRRRMRSHRHLIDRSCGHCDEVVSSFARFCPRCKRPIRHRGRTFALALVAGLCSTAMVWVLALNRTMPSPFPGVSDERFTYCVQISRTWSESVASSGPVAAATLRARGEWHAACSRKALRDVPDDAGTRLPVTPEGWIAAAPY